MCECWFFFKAAILFIQLILAIIALVAALMACSNIDLRHGYGQYFVGSGDDYEKVRESDRLQRLALILGISGYWVYIGVVITAAVGLGVGSRFSSKCLPATWFLTAVLLLVSVFAVSINVVSLVFSVDATHSFNSVAPRVMVSALRHHSNVSLSNITGSSRQDVEHDKTVSSVGVLWDKLHYELECCGSRGVADYVSVAWNGSMEDRSKAIAPLSCCRPTKYTSTLSLTCRSNGTDPADYFAEGCSSVLSRSSTDDKKLVISLSCFVILLVVTSVFYVVVDSRMSNDNDDD